MEILTSSGTTLADMREQVYFLADEEPDALFPYSAVDRLINRALVLVGEKIGRQPVTATTVTFPGETAYPLIDPFFDFTGNASVSAVTVGGIALVSGTDFTVGGGSVILATEPTDALDMSVTYLKELTPVTLPTDASTLGIEAVEAACIHAVFMLKLKDDEATIADRWRNEFDTRLKGLMSLRTGVYKAS